MYIKKEAVREYLVNGIPYRALAKKHEVSRSTINKWVLVLHDIHNIPRSHKQVSYALQQKKLGTKSCTEATNQQRLWADTATIPGLQAIPVR